MLGLGDIVSIVCMCVWPCMHAWSYILILQILPGLLLCFAMRYDHVVMRATIATDRVSLACSKWSYFQISICGYALGMEQIVYNSVLFIGNCSQGS